MVTLDGYFNASMASAGLPARSWLNLGLPIVLSLEPQERVFVIAHELAHAVNRDPRRGFWMWQALHFLHRIWAALRPTAIWEEGSGMLGLMAALANLIMLAASYVPWTLGWLLLQLSGEASQRAEYHADLLAAGVSGTAAASSALDKLHLSELYDYSLHKQRVAPERPHVFAELRFQMRQVPEERWQALREAQERDQSTLDASHPPTVYRMAVLGAHPQKGRVNLDAGRAGLLEVELSLHVKPLGKAAYDAYLERVH